MTPARTTDGGPTEPRRRGRPPRVSAEEWTAHALAVLTAEGLGAVQINRLCGDLGVTRGAFYWHFGDLDALHRAVAARWCEQTRSALVELTALREVPPRERLRLMTLRLIDDTAWGVERALREWARSDGRVDDVIAESDLFVFSLVEGALLELELPALEARAAAGVLVYAGIGFAGGQSALPKPTGEEVDTLLDLVTRGAYTGPA